MAEDCRIAHGGDAHALHDHPAASDGPLSEIATDQGVATKLSSKVLSPRARRSVRPVICSAPVRRRPSSVGAVERLISLNVNGQTRRVDVLPYETLANTLRYKLGLTGTKLSCDRGECGACTVIADGTTIYSCTTLTHAVAGQEDHDDRRHCQGR